MKLKVIENRKDKVKLEVSGETHTLLNLLRENAWRAGARQASYIVKHPYMTQPVIIAMSKNPKKTLSDAAQTIIDDVKDFEKEFKRAFKK